MITDEFDYEELQDLIELVNEEENNLTTEN